MSTQQGTRIENADINKRLSLGMDKGRLESIRNGRPNSGPDLTGFDGGSPKRPAIRKVQSTVSLSSNASVDFQNNGAKSTGTKSWKCSSEIEVGERVNDRTLMAQGGVESGFRERLPSFTIRRAVVPARLHTHFAVYKFMPRHKEELAMNIGDAIHVEKIFDDLWYEGTNLRSGEQGIFPSRYASDILSNTGPSFEFFENGVQFYLRFLGSVEVFEFKGNTVLCQAIAKILNIRKNSRISEIPPCSLEIDHRGIRLIDHAQENEKRQSKSFVGRLFNNEQKVFQTKYFFKLKDVTFCGCYPNAPRYFGFVTKHPSEHRFACHTFMSEYSTEPVAKAIGQAFKRFYADYVERSSSR